MPYRYGRRSLDRLGTCHQYLQTLMLAVLEDPGCPVDVSILCGHRTRDEQDAAYRRGATKLRWPKSKHNSFPSMAVDAAPYVNGAVSWDWTHYHPLAAHIKAVWARLSAEGKVSGQLEWGGDWRSFKDGPHWQLEL